MRTRPEQRASSVAWHDLECGAYRADIPLWRALAEEHGDPILDVGAGTGRIALELVRLGHRVTALDQDSTLLGALAHRAEGLPVRTVEADARQFDLDERFALIIAPMQTIQLLEGEQARGRFLRCAARHLETGGVLAVAITEVVERYNAGDPVPPPMPDIQELDGVVYSSRPTAVREDRDGFILERRRETIGPAGERTAERDVVRLDRVTAAQLEREAVSSGLRRGGRRTIPATRDHVGSVVVILRG